MDTRTPVSADYLSPNAFNGKLKSAKIEVRASRLSVEEERQVRVLNQKAVLAAH
jgi:phosphatidylserine decarboxylase